MLNTCLMIQGTSSDAGKTTLVAALCRVLVRKNKDVAPFKPQNMALNSAVTNDGGEIGRAQALQAQACRLDAHTDMNPVLIKPSSDVGAQIIIHGRALKNMDAQDFHSYKPLAKASVLESFSRLSNRHDFIVVEGAGSPAEINLREGDIANMGFAEAVDCPVVLVADIDRGGVFAQLVGTLELLSASEQKRVVGFVINKFRGDISLLEPGLDWLEKRTGKPVFGVLPYLHNFFIDAEDAIDTRHRENSTEQLLRIIVPVLPRISNHTDFDSLRQHPEVELRFVSSLEVPGPADVVILPGSKNVREDLATLRENGWELYLKRHLRFGGKLVGICGGYQMLGEQILDNQGIEGPAGESGGFGFIPMDTRLLGDKTLRKKKGSLRLNKVAAAVEGYEIHHGESQIKTATEAVIRYEDGSSDGFLDDSQQILGFYLHGVFDQSASLTLFLSWAGLKEHKPFDLNAAREEALERLADTLEEHVDLQALFNESFDACENSSVKGKSS